MKDIFKLEGDRPLWYAIITLLIASVVIMASTTKVLGYRTGQPHLIIWLRHLTFAAIAFFLVFRIHRADYRSLLKNPWIIPIIYWFSILLLVLTLAAGVEINDARRWLRLPFIGIQFQSSDIARIALLLFLALRYITDPDHQKPNTETPFGEAMQQQLFRYILPISLTTGLILIADLSTAVLTGLTAFVFLFMMGLPLRYLIAWGVLAAGLLIAFFFIAPYIGIERAATWQNRLLQMNQDTPPYQARLAMAAIHKGTFLGAGPGGSILRDFLPNSFSDYVYAIILEEYGWLGMSIILASFLMLFIRGLHIFHRVEEPFGRGIVIGMTLLITFQALFHIMVNVGLFPVTGLTLPMVSMGGTSMLILSTALGLILSVARVHEAEKQSHSDPHPDPAYE